MKDFAELLDVTEAVEVEYLGKKITCHVYTAGDARLRAEDRARLKLARKPLVDSSERIKELQAQIDALDSSSNGEGAKLETELGEILTRLSGVFEETVPVMVASFEHEGEPLTLRGQPITRENIGQLPDQLVLAVALKAGEVWGRPTTGVPSENGTPESSTETNGLGQSPTEIITPSPVSEQPPAG
jgi:hypothetical protein